MNSANPFGPNVLNSPIFAKQMMEVRPDFGPLVDRYWPKADIYVAFDVAFHCSLHCTCPLSGVKRTLWT
jgi:hypothetical protein